MSSAEGTPPTPRLSAKDLVGPLLIFLGCFLLAATLALPTLFVNNLRAVPLSTDFTTAAQTTERATILDRCSLATPRARTVEANLIRQQRVVAVQPSDGRRITLQAGTSVQAEEVWFADTPADGEGEEPDTERPGSEDWPDDQDCTSATLNAYTDRITLNRGTALPDLGADTDGSTGSSEIQYDAASAPVPAGDRAGFTYLLPIDPPTTGLQFFDPLTRQTVAVEPTGEREVAGRAGSTYTAEIGDTDLAAINSGSPDGVPPTIITRPASWFGIEGGDPERELTATLHHRAQWELVVDEATGTILDQTLTIQQGYRIFGEDDFELPAMSAIFAFTDQTRDRMADRAADLNRPILLWGRIVPIISGILGLLAVGAGIYFVSPGSFAGVVRRVRPGQSPS